MCDCRFESSSIQKNPDGYWEGQVLLPSGESCVNRSCSNPEFLCQNDGLCYGTVDVMGDPQAKGFSKIEPAKRPECDALFSVPINQDGVEVTIGEMANTAIGRDAGVFYVDRGENTVYFYRSLPPMSSLRVVVRRGEPAAGNVMYVANSLFSSREYARTDKCGLNPSPYPVARWPILKYVVMLIPILILLYFIWPIK